MWLRTWFMGTIETRTALHIGTGTELSLSTNAPLLRGADGLPLVPGSSVKGALRSASERLLRALGHRACLVFDEGDPGDPTLRCLTTDEKQNKLFLKLKSNEELSETERQNAKEWFRPPAEWGSKPWERFGTDESKQRTLLEKGGDGQHPLLCKACLTWGSPFMAGRVKAPDLRLSLSVDGGPLGVHTEIRDGVGLDRDTGTAADRIKFDLEVLPAGARFPFELVAEPEANLGVVALAVGELLQGNVPLGGRVTRGLGDVKLTNFQIQEVDLSNPETLVAYLTQKKRTSFEENKATDKLAKMLSVFSGGT